MEEVLFWSLFGSGMSSIVTGWLIRASGLRQNSGARHGFAQDVSDPLKPEMQDWIPIRPSEAGFWVRIGIILLVATSIISAIAKLVEAISNLID